jgi:hypothetical protein
MLSLEVADEALSSCCASRPKKYISTSPLFFASIFPRYTQGNESFSSAYVAPLILIFPGSLLLSIRAAVFTVSPQMTPLEQRSSIRDQLSLTAMVKTS